MNAPTTPAMFEPDAQWASRTLDAMLARVARHFRPRERLAIHEWAERYRRLSAEENPDYQGSYRLDNTPALRGILAACSDRGIRSVVVQKSAQIGYTAGVVCNVLGYYAHWRPRVQVVMFPREKSAKDFDAEKFTPMVRATPVLAEVINLKSRADGNSATRKKLRGGRGLIKFVASNSPADVKSTSASVRIVEEPDDTNRDVRGQGDSIALLRERGKSIRDSFELIGGTPTAKGASAIEKEMRTTDQRRFMVPCHHCGEAHEVEWEHVHIPGFGLSPEQLAEPDIDERLPYRDVYGRARWEHAYYACPHCGGVWTDEDRHDNIRRAAAQAPHYGWHATAPGDRPGFYCNELQSIFEGSNVTILAEKFCRAHDAMERGEPELMVAFTNSTRGQVWEYRGELPEEDELRERAETYAEWSVPAGGLVVLIGVDVQHDRLAVTVWVVGRGEEMWLAWGGDLYGRTIIPDQGAWLELAALLERSVRPASGALLPVAGMAIDCGDGQTSDAVYAFVRRHNRRSRPVIATKGASDKLGRAEIWAKPRAIDPNKKATKASKYGVHVHIIGTVKAKDTILGWAQEGGRVRLPGSGPGRMHWPSAVRPDFYEQLLGELKVPMPSNPRQRVWVPRTDRRNEALDCTVMCLWLSRHLQLHLRKPHQWAAAASRMLQTSLLDDTDDDAATPSPITDDGAPPPAGTAPPWPGITHASAPKAPEPAADELPIVQAAHAAQAARPSTSGGRISLGAGGRFGGGR